MGIIDQTREQIEPVYAAAVAQADHVRQAAYVAKVAKIMSDRSETLRTEDIDLALVHFLGSKAFEPLVIHRINMTIGDLTYSKSEEQDTPVMLIARMHPQQSAQRHTSLGLLPAGPFVFESAVARHEGGSYRSFGIVAKTATIAADIERKTGPKGTVYPRHPKAEVTPTLPLKHYFEADVPIKRDINNWDDEIVDRGTQSGRSLFVGWEKIAGKRLRWYFDQGNQFVGAIQEGELQVNYFKILVQSLGLRASAPLKLWSAEDRLTVPDQGHHLSLDGVQSYHGRPAREFSQHP